MIKEQSYVWGALRYKILLFNEAPVTKDFITVDPPSEIGLANVKLLYSFDQKTS